MKTFVTTLIIMASMTAAAQSQQITGVSSNQKAPEKVEKIASSPGDVAAVAECIYCYDLLNGDKRSTGAAMLQIAPSVARFIDYTSFATDSLRRSGDTDREQFNRFLSRELRCESFIDQTILQGFPSGKMTVISPIAPNLYTYTETAYPLPWTLAGEVDTIAGYECHKATATYGGRDWTAWYTTEVPVSFGPWKLTGLPGLAHTFRVHSLQISETGRDVLLQRLAQRLAPPQQPHCGTGNHHGQRQHRSICHPQ
ncbi:MAG: GLPGLI family protein [Duncaniella sp.]|nr:GLPGLI family protein [Duncaniella sp.]